jgi:hypothetical protein
MEREALADLKPADVIPHAESAAPVDMRPIEITTHEAAPCRCSPCTGGRAAAAPTPLIVLGLIGLNYIPLVLFLLDQQLDGGRVVSIVFFHLFLILLLRREVRRSLRLAHLRREGLLLLRERQPLFLQLPKRCGDDHAISGNQWQSVAISGNQWQSAPTPEALRGRPCK